VIVLVETLSTFPTYKRLDTEFLLQFPCKAFFSRFPVLDFTSWKLPEPSELFPRDRRVSKTQPFLRMIAAVTIFSQLMLQPYQK
jgi:hypothetical protein